MKKKLLYLLPILALSACSSVNTAQDQRLDSLEEKVDALLVYNNKTYDILVDNELRIAELEKDAKKRGVPVPQKLAGVETLKQAQSAQPQADIRPAAQPAAENQLQENLQKQQNLPEQKADELAKQEVGVITGQDLTKQDFKAEETTQQKVAADITEAPKPVPQTQAAEQKQAVQTAGAQQTAALGTQPVRQAPQKTEQALSSKDMYNKAYGLYQQRQYAQAEKLFDEFLAKYPQDVLAPNALYWKGETLYARAIYSQAIFAFKEVQTRYPKHPKTADSLLKTAMCYARLGDTENAGLHYLVLMEDWPNSEAARKAKAMGAK